MRSAAEYFQATFSVYYIGGHLDKSTMQVTSVGGNSILYTIFGLFMMCRRPVDPEELANLQTHVFPQPPFKLTV